MFSEQSDGKKTTRVCDSTAAGEESEECDSLIHLRTGASSSEEQERGD